MWKFISFILPSADAHREVGCDYVMCGIMGSYVAIAVGSVRSVGEEHLKHFQTINNKHSL